MDNAQTALLRKSEDDFKRSGAGRLFWWEKVTSRATEGQIQQLLGNTGNNSKDPRLEEVGKKMREQGNTDLEYSSIFSDVIGKIHKEFWQDRGKMIEALKTIWYDQTNAEKIYERTHLDGKVNSHDRDLIAALKSMGTSGSKWWTNSWWSTFTADKVVWDDSKIRINFNDQDIKFSIKDGSYSDKDKDSLVKMISWLTEEEFRKKSAWVSSTITDKIIKDMAWKFKDPSKANPTPAATPTPAANPNPSTSPKP